MTNIWKRKDGRLFKFLMEAKRTETEKTKMSSLEVELGLEAPELEILDNQKGWQRANKQEMKIRVNEFDSHPENEHGENREEAVDRDQEQARLVVMADAWATDRM